MDHTIHWTELRAVNFTAAAKNNFSQLAGAATEASLKSREMRSVRQTSLDDGIAHRGAVSWST